MSIGFFRALVALAVLMPVGASAQSVAILGNGASENFDSLAASGSSDVLPTGWYLAESDDNANGNYTASDGFANSGDTYSFGTGSTSERAFGALQSGSLVPVIGARLQNLTGATLNELALQYNGEQWRLGALAREDRLVFQVSVNATSLDDVAATWTAVPALDFVAPVDAGTVGALDGNVAANRALVMGSITGLSVAPGANFWIRWVDVNAAGPDDGLAIDDIVFGTPGDVPPAVQSTTPADGAQNVLPDSVVTIGFSEPVTATGNWYQIECADAGVVTAVASGGPQNFTLTPSTDFAEGDVCTMTVFAANVVDQDKAPDPMAEDFEATFGIFDPASNDAPQVVSTFPLSDSSSFPAAGSMQVVFSEPVQLAADAFALVCTESGAVDLSHAASGTSINISLGSVLVAGESCAFIIEADAVQDEFGAPMAADFSFDFNVADGASGYYSQVNESNPEQLRCSLHQTIRGHQLYFYSWDSLEIADEAPPDVCAPGDQSGADYILDVYRNRCYQKPEQRSGGTGPNFYNREHTWPRSLGFSSPTIGGEPNPPHNDFHMLHLSASDWNGSRGSKPYDNCNGCAALGTDANNGVGGPGDPGNFNYSGPTDGPSGSFEVWDHMKGNMARAVLYMAIRYEGGMHPEGIPEPDLELTSDRSVIASPPPGKNYMGILSTLLEWHQFDPPDARELQRNEVIFAFQGNRNPFIDNPQWATLELFTSSNPPTCELTVPVEPEIFADGFETAPAP